MHFQNVKNKALALSTAALLFGTAGSVGAGVLAMQGGGHQVSYAIDMTPGISTGGDILGTFIFEWNGNEFNLDHAGRVEGQGVTNLSHSVDFAPTSSLLLGYSVGNPATGSGAKHIYMVASKNFADSVEGSNWSQVFRGTVPNERMKHNKLVSLLIDAEAGSQAAITEITNFVNAEARVGAFDPNGEFRVIEWSEANTIGVNAVPEPASIVLLALGLMGLAVAKRYSMLRRLNYR